MQHTESIAVADHGAWQVRTQPLVAASGQHAQAPAVHVPTCCSSIIGPAFHGGLQNTGVRLRACHLLLQLGCRLLGGFLGSFLLGFQVLQRALRSSQILLEGLC